MQTETTPIRIFFKKEGRAKYIAHLDCNRLLQRSLKRSGLPVWYTQGYHPHMYIAYALPISLGYESLCESMDLKFTEAVEEGEILAALQRALPEGFTATHAAPPAMKPEAIVWGDYDLTLHLADGPAAARSFAAFMEQESIPAMKKSKKGVQEVDLRPHIRVRDAAGEGETLCLGLTLAAGTSLNINPALVAETFCTYAGLEHRGLDVLRRQLYTADFAVFE